MKGPTEIESQPTDNMVRDDEERQTEQCMNEWMKRRIILKGENTECGRKKKKIFSLAINVTDTDDDNGDDLDATKRTLNDNHVDDDDVDKNMMR